MLSFSTRPGLSCVQLATRGGCVRLRRITTSAVPEVGKKELEVPAPGTVKDYNSHIFIRTRPPAAVTASAFTVPWWPADVEREAPFKQALLVAARLRDEIPGPVKVTAYEETDGRLPPRTGHCDVLMFPEGSILAGSNPKEFDSGIRYSNLPEKHLQSVIEFGLQTLYDDGNDEGPQEVQHLQDHEDRVCLFVCSHIRRDVRCGVIGPPLVAALNGLVRDHSLESKISVKYCSHVGGHKYAGNILVFGPMSPCNGDWYGGVNPENAADFFSAFINVKVDGQGGPNDPQLKKFWRGRMGLTKEEQVEFHECGCLPNAVNIEVAEDYLGEPDDDVSLKSNRS